MWWGLLAGRFDGHASATFELVLWLAWPRSLSFSVFPAVLDSVWERDTTIVLLRSATSKRSGNY